MNRSALAWLVIPALFLLLITVPAILAPDPTAIAYSDFKALVRAGHVRDLALGSDTIQGTLAPTADRTALQPRLGADTLARLDARGGPFSTQRVEGPGGRDPGCRGSPSRCRRSSSPSSRRAPSSSPSTASATRSGSGSRRSWPPWPTGSRHGWSTAASRPRRTTRSRRMSQAVEHHVAEEEGQMFREAERLGDGELTRLGDELAKDKRTRKESLIQRGIRGMKLAAKKIA